MTDAALIARLREIECSFWDRRKAADRLAALGKRAADLFEQAEGWQQRATKAEAERDAIYRFARLNGLMAIDIQNAIDAAIAGANP